MAGLVLELKQDELIMINGASIKFRTKSRIEINGRARFLFGKQILASENANTPAARLYLALQTAYIGNEADRPEAQRAAGALLDLLGPEFSQERERLRDLLQKNDSYEALKLARALIRQEAAAGAEAATRDSTARR